MSLKENEDVGPMPT